MTCAVCGSREKVIPRHNRHGVLLMQCWDLHLCRSAAEARANGTADVEHFDRLIDDAKAVASDEYEARFGTRRRR